MRIACQLSLALGFSVALAAQGTATGVIDVGLTMQNGPSTGTITGLVGQRCGAFTCQPFGGNVPAPANALVRPVRIYGDANSLYILGMSTGPTAAPCIPIPGIGNALIISQPMAAISIGVTGAYLPSTTLACRQGVATFQLALPPVAIGSVPFLLQALTFSFATQGPAFTVAVRGVAN